jgi:hypothetical protein
MSEELGQGVMLRRNIFGGTAQRGSQNRLRHATLAQGRLPAHFLLESDRHRMAGTVAR